ncbi:MAG: hypothetical protein WDN24_05830 [Sphingomonas sp.]
MSFKGYQRYGLPKDVWQEFNFEEGFSDLEEKRRQAFLKQQAKGRLGRQAEDGGARPMSGSRIFAALAALAVAAPAAAQDFRTIGASETVVLDPSRSYLIVQISAGGGALPSR